MMKYEAPVVEIEVFAVENIMNDYDDEDFELTENMTDIL